MRFLRALLFVMPAIVYPIGEVAAAPSFNCKNAKALVEKEICGSEEFEALDRDIASLYSRSLAALSKDDAALLREDQRAWVRERNECEDMIRGDPPVVIDVLACMRQTMDARRERLQAILDRKQFFKS